jgi:hypothetical protein
MRHFIHVANQSKDKIWTVIEKILNLDPFISLYVRFETGILKILRFQLARKFNRVYKIIEVFEFY